MSIPSFNEWKETNRGKGINEYFEAFPEARVSSNNQPIIIQNPSRDSDNNDWSFILWIVLTIALGIGAYFGIQKYNQSRLEKYQKQIEYHAPQKYLVLYNTKGDFTLLGKSIVTGTIENKSNHTTYVNIFVAVEFYDKDGNYIKRKKVSLDERMEPLDYTDFKLKTNFPWKARSYQVKLASADVLRQKGN